MEESRPELKSTGLGSGSGCQMLEKEKLAGYIQCKGSLMEMKVLMEFLINHLYKNGTRGASWAYYILLWCTLKFLNENFHWWGKKKKTVEAVKQQTGFWKWLNWVLKDPI